MTPDEHAAVIAVSIRGITTRRQAEIGVEIAAAIKAAVAEEREACAQIARRHCDDAWESGSACCGNEIAAAIRAAGKETTR